MVVKQNKGYKVTFRVISGEPLKVKTLKEYKESKKQILKKRIILKDTDDEILFLNADNIQK